MTLWYGMCISIYELVYTHILIVRLNSAWHLETLFLGAPVIRVIQKQFLPNKFIPEYTAHRLSLTPTIIFPESF